MANSWTTAGGTIQILFGCSGISSPPPVLFTLSLWDVTHHAKTSRNDCWFLPDIVLCTEKNVFADSLGGLFMTSGSTLCTTEPTAEISKLLLGDIRTKWVPKRREREVGNVKGVLVYVNTLRCLSGAGPTKWAMLTFPSEMLWNISWFGMCFEVMQLLQTLKQMSESIFREFVLEDTSKFLLRMQQLLRQKW